MKAFVVYVTASSHEEALAIGRAVVGERLAAAAHTLGDMRSVYWWNGQFVEDAEAVLILVTTDARLGTLIQRIRELHSYTTPCITAWPIAAGNPDYLAWIEAETANTEP